MKSDDAGGVPCDVMPSDVTMREIERRIVADLHPVRPIASRRWFLIAFAGTFVLIVAISVFFAGAFALAAMSRLQTTTVLSALAASAALLVCSLTQQMVPGSRHRISPAFLPVFVAILLTPALAVVFRVRNEHHFLTASWICLKSGVAVASAAAVPFWLLLRRGTILSPQMTGTAAGLLAGLVGTTALEIHCPDLNLWHILASHLGVAILSSMAGFVTGLTAETIGNRSHHISYGG